MEPLMDGDQVVEGVSFNKRCIATDGVILVTLTLINEKRPDFGRNELEEASLFQTKVTVRPCEGTRLVPKPSHRSAHGSDEADQFSDASSQALLYRNVTEFAVGHVCSAHWQSVDPESGLSREADWVATTWIPSAITHGVDPNGHKVFSELSEAIPGFDVLAAHDLAWAAPNELCEGLHQFCSAYNTWLSRQDARLRDPQDVSSDLVPTAQKHLDECRSGLSRMSDVVEIIRSDSRLRRAFQLANLVMDLQYSWDAEKSDRGPLRWRPFQLGFLLLSLHSSVDRTHRDREVMDLLWFPTGGGKTEAYLALVACVAIHRRLTDNADAYGGVCALMRYTLRLLTTQQFARSAAMILALEAVRTGQVRTPEGMQIGGREPFSIGLWVGRDATPNWRSEANSSLSGSSDVSSPKQLSHCPCCGNQLIWSSRDRDSPVQVECRTEDCMLRGCLPVYTVDEDIYDRRPTLLIGTADKFAQVVRKPETNQLFSVLDGNPPELIIQDELHLISGPLGTIAGIYEAAFDILFTRDGFRAKVVGSTATIRRAEDQVLALFDRKAFQFPPPALDHDDSGFAVRDHRPSATGRRYLGITTAGRSAKFTLQAVAGSLLQTAYAAFDEDARRDAYWSLVGYFNSLRELGGALVLMQDDVSDSLKLFAEAREEALRNLASVEELTSRRSQLEIRDMLAKLAIKSGDPGAVDVVLATNMVSVGVDISRLGLMVVNGQPKTISEYIQSTSRVGRGGVSGLVVSVLNNAKARDRSRYETFCNWHQTLYRDVEATSVTPFASRARDKALHAALVAVVRHKVGGMLDKPNMSEDAEDEALKLVDALVERAQRVDPEETMVRVELERRLDSWIARHPSVYWSDFKGDKSLLQSAEKAAALKASGRSGGNAWPTPNSMRNVEAGTPFRLAPMLKLRGEESDEE